MSTGGEPRRRLALRQERDGRDVRYLEAYVDVEGDLHIDGQDLGPSTPDGEEYEWFQTIAAADVPRLAALLGADPGRDILDVLAEWVGSRSYEMEAVLRTSGIPVKRWLW